MKNWLKIFLLLVAAAGLLLSFQNCGNTGFLKSVYYESAYSSSIDPLFAYPYQTRPSVYFDSVVTIPADAVATDRFAEIEFVGAMAPVDGSYSTIQYRLEIRDQNNVRICPEQTGSLTGNTDIRFKCITTGTPAQSVKVWAEITLNASTFVLEKSFQ